MDISEVKEHLGHKVVLNDTFHHTENIPCILRAYRLAKINGKIFHQVELEDLKNRRCVIYAPLESIEIIEISEQL